MTTARAMGLSHTPAMFIPMTVKAFVCNILKRFKARARGPKGCKIYCFNQYGRRVIKANDNAFDWLNEEK